MTRKTIDHTESVTVLHLYVDGVKFTYATRLNGRDPMEMTLGEWQRDWALSGEAMLFDVVSSHKYIMGGRSG